MKVMHVVVSVIISLTLSTQLTAGQTNNLSLIYSDDVHPISYIENNQPKGQGIELCKKIIHAYQKKHVDKIVKPDWKKTTMVNRFIELNHGQVDMNCSIGIITEKRKELYLFSVPYITTHTVIVSKKMSHIKDVKDLRGTSVGVVLGGLSAERIQYLNTKYNLSLNIVREDNYTSLINGLVGGKVNSIIGEELIINNYAHTLNVANNLDFIKSEDFPASNYGIAFSKNNKELKNIADKIINHN